MDGVLIAFWVIVGVAVLAAIIWGIYGFDRYRSHRHLPGGVPTTEVTIDPVTRQRLRVWVDPATGERSYVPEDGPGYTQAPPLERPGVIMPTGVPDGQQPGYLPGGTVPPAALPPGQGGPPPWP